MLKAALFATSIIIVGCCQRTIAQQAAPPQMPFNGFGPDGRPSEPPFGQQTMSSPPPPFAGRPDNPLMPSEPGSNGNAPREPWRESPQQMPMPGPPGSMPSTPRPAAGDEQNGAPPASQTATSTSTPSINPNDIFRLFFPPSDSTPTTATASNNNNNNNNNSDDGAMPASVQPTPAPASTRTAGRTATAPTSVNRVEGFVRSSSTASHTSSPSSTSTSSKEVTPDVSLARGVVEIQCYPFILALGMACLGIAI
ncbi:hypothetical protein SYNPS1DRAFT_28756 [Syncephalis pseudoplumigaleata]|uniref:Uncharacterized protein n=1 Tax=Syncephalis pseudoplumigaleata TaxID=1712513 RepID=A0A4P9YZI8_9FUNG|nr:hypothetical protein SYNPS1DRAFT_28756 [Syncephalis pseudoplumigaleata]|eukprot:RKP25514.1 hypothetical protein SYNPS1DRAFT_28756 [Syncephalis pseudoplumigaleata]